MNLIYAADVSLNEWLQNNLSLGFKVCLLCMSTVHDIHSYTGVKKEVWVWKILGLNYTDS